MGTPIWVRYVLHRVLMVGWSASLYTRAASAYYWACVGCHI